MIHKDRGNSVLPKAKRNPSLTRLADDGWKKGVSELRNYFKYGNKLGPSIDDVIKKHTSDGVMDWKEAYDALWTTNKTFDKLK